MEGILDLKTMPDHCVLLAQAVQTPVDLEIGFWIKVLAHDYTNTTGVVQIDPGCHDVNVRNQDLCLRIGIGEEAESFNLRTLLVRRSYSQGEESSHLHRSIH